MHAFFRPRTLLLATLALACAGAAAAGHAPLPLPFHYDLYSFRGEGGRTDIVAAFAVPAGSLYAERADGRSRYRFNVSFVLADTARRTVFRTDDSVFVAVPRRLHDEHLLRTHLETSARPSLTTVRRAVVIDAPHEAIGSGQLYTDAWPVPDYAGSRLLLSDVALGLTGGETGWRRGDVELALLPGGYVPGGALDVYYEVYNLPGGTTYGTELHFEPLDAEGRSRGGDERAVRVSFSGEAVSDAEGTVRELRHVDGRLRPGRYRLTVTVRDERSGGTASRSRDLHVREEWRGATFAPACPAGVWVDRPRCRRRGSAPPEAGAATTAAVEQTATSG